MGFLLILTIIVTNGVSINTILLPNYKACEDAKKAFLAIKYDRDFVTEKAICVEYNSASYRKGFDPTKARK